MKTHKSTSNQKAGAPKPRKHVPKQPQVGDTYAYNYALWLLRGKPQPRGRKPKAPKPPLYWLPFPK